MKLTVAVLFLAFTTSVYAFDDLKRTSALQDNPNCAQDLVNKEYITNKGDFDSTLKMAHFECNKATTDLLNCGKGLVDQKFVTQENKYEYYNPFSRAVSNCSRFTLEQINCAKDLIKNGFSKRDDNYFLNEVDLAAGLCANKNK